MPYTARQLQGLDALGVVPWVLKEAAAQTSVVEAKQSPVIHPPVADIAQSPAVPTMVKELSVKPASLEGLGDWLPTQALAPFTYRSKTLDRIGKEDAPILFLMDKLPLSDTEARLLNDMLRAIDLDPRDTCLVCLDSSESTSTTVPSVLHAGTRAVLYFSDMYISDAQQADHAFSIASRHGWCLPTLKTLQEQPQLKRQAWNSLKGLQALLAG